MAKTTAFIIDNDPVFCTVATAKFRLLGIADTIVMFNDGLQAYDRIMELLDIPHQMPTLILVNIKMPLMDGWEIIKRIEPKWIEINPKTLLYATTSAIIEDDLILKRNYDYVEALITKPLTDSHLRQIKQAMQW